jgi:CBS domain-containing protein
MRRVNIQAAFVGEGGDSDHGDEEGIALAVRGGEVIVVVPAGTTDDGAVASASTLRGSLRLETGRVLLFEIHDGAVGAFFEDEPAALFDRREEAPADGLSTMSSQSSKPEHGSFGGAAALRGTSAVARDIMTPGVISIAPDQSVDEAAGLLTFHGISGMPVCDQGRVVGVLSEADLIGKSGSVVGQVMTTPAVTALATTPLEEVARLLLDGSIRRVPVTDAEQLVGVVTRGDVLRWAASHGPSR